MCWGVCSEIVKRDYFLSYYVEYSQLIKCKEIVNGMVFKINITSQILCASCEKEPVRKQPRRIFSIRVICH
jgi:hypothetical protein